MKTSELLAWGSWQPDPGFYWAHERGLHGKKQGTGFAHQQPAHPPRPGVSSYHRSSLGLREKLVLLPVLASCQLQKQAEIPIVDSKVRATWCVESNTEDRKPLRSKQDANSSFWIWPFQPSSKLPPPSPTPSAHPHPSTYRFTPFKPNREKAEYCLLSPISSEQHWQGSVPSSRGCDADNFNQVSLRMVKPQNIPAEPAPGRNLKSKAFLLFLLISLILGGKKKKNFMSITRRNINLLKNWTLLDLEGKAWIPDVALCTSEASAFVFPGIYSVVLKYKPTQLQLDFSVLDIACCLPSGKARSRVTGRRTPSGAGERALVWHQEMNCSRIHTCWQNKRFYWEGAAEWRAGGKGTQEDFSAI